MHHANLLIGDYEWCLSQIPEDERVSSSDVSLRQFDRMAIADAHALIHDAGLRPVSREHRTFIVSANSILPEAQNALLKVFEDSLAHVRFFLIVPRKETLLPTVASRFFLFASGHTVINSNAFTLFLSLSYKERLAEIVRRLDAEDNEWVRHVILGFAQYAEESRDTQYIRTALMAETYIFAPGASKKMILEHIALSLPVK